MKRLLCILFLTLFLLPATGTAQLLKSYGVKAAITSASQSFDYPTFHSFPRDFRRRIGFGVGVYAEWLNVPFISILTQIEYIQRGSREGFAVTGPDGPTVLRTDVLDRRLDYLSIPILFKAFTPLGSVTPYVLVGPRLDLLLGYRDETASDYSVFQDFRKTSFGGTVGAGFDVADLLPVKFSVEFRTNIDFGDSYNTEFLKIRNSAYDIWIGVAL
jgi:hypothetical protein